MVRIENIQNSKEKKLLIEVRTYSPAEDLKNLKESIIETLYDSISNEHLNSDHTVYLIRFLKELIPDVEDIEKGLLKN